MSRYVIGITGASGAPYARRVVEALLAQGHRVDLVISRAGEVVLADECGWRRDGEGFAVPEPDPRSQWDKPRRLLGGYQAAFWGYRGQGELWLYDIRDVSADIASGTSGTSGMAVVPCSMSTVSALAHGQSGNLLERAADVHLKERRRLVVVPRETPLHLIHVRNLTQLVEAGAMLLPAMPGFYHRPSTIEELIDFIAGKVLLALGLEQALLPPWQGLPGE